MWSSALLMALLAPQVEYGWQPGADGQLEYVLQLEPVAIAALRAGKEISSDVHPDIVRRVRRFVARAQTPLGPRPASDGRALKPAAQYGWKPGTDGRLEYYIQLNMAALEALECGQEISGNIHSEVVGKVERLVLRLGEQALPRVLPTQSDPAPNHAAREANTDTQASARAPEPSGIDWGGWFTFGLTNAPADLAATPQNKQLEPPPVGSSLRSVTTSDIPSAAGETLSAVGTPPPNRSALLLPPDPRIPESYPGAQHGMFTEPTDQSSSRYRSRLSENVLPPSDDHRQLIRSDSTLPGPASPSPVGGWPPVNAVVDPYARPAVSPPSTTEATLFHAEGAGDAALDSLIDKRATATTRESLQTTAAQDTEPRTSGGVSTAAPDAPQNSSASRTRTVSDEGHGGSGSNSKQPVGSRANPTLDGLLQEQVRNADPSFSPPATSSQVTSSDVWHVINELLLFASLGINVVAIVIARQYYLRYCMIVQEMRRQPADLVQ